MKLYKQVSTGILGNVTGYRREILVHKQALALGIRYSSNINECINNRAGLFSNTRDIMINVKQANKFFIEA